MAAALLARLSCAFEGASKALVLTGPAGAPSWPPAAKPGASRAAELAACLASVLQLPDTAEDAGRSGCASGVASTAADQAACVVLVALAAVPSVLTAPAAAVGTGNPCSASDGFSKVLES